MVPGRRWLLISLLGSCSCATLTNFESARTLEPGKWQVAAEGRLLLTRSTSSGDTNAFPAVAVRHGVTKHFELGLRAGMSRPEIFGKWQLVDGAVAIALSQSLGVWRWIYSTGNSHTQAWSRTALPIGVPVGPSELVISPMLHLAFGGSDSGASGFAFVPGASVGFLWRPLWWLGVMPQLSAGFAAVSVASREVVIGGGGVFEGGLAVIVGGREGF